MNIELGKNISPREIETKIQEFWDKNTIPCGKGATVEEAVGNLYIVLHK